MDLEAKVALKGDDSGGSSRPGNSQDNSRRLPKGPARAVLAGHRGPITSVAVHPVFRWHLMSLLMFVVFYVFILI